MGKPKLKPLIAGETTIRSRPSRSWCQTPGMQISGQSFIDEADKLAAMAESKWGCGRLRLLVPSELREKFDRQRYLFNQAIWHGDIEAVRVQSARMCAAWRALDTAAESSGAAKLDPQIMEVVLATGVVAAIVPDGASASLVRAEDRRMDVYTLEEIARLLNGFPALAKIKQSYPGAEVVVVRRSIGDPLDSFVDSELPIDEIPF